MGRKPVHSVGDAIESGCGACRFVTGSARQCPAHYADALPTATKVLLPVIIRRLTRADPSRSL